MTSVLQRSATVSSFPSKFSLESNSGCGSVVATPNSTTTTNRAMNSDLGQVSDAESHQQPTERYTTGTTRRPLQEEKTEPYYPDDTRKAPQPTPEELSAFHIKIRDFAYEPNKYPPIKPYQKYDPDRIQRQPDPRTWKGFAGDKGLIAGEDGESLALRQKGFYNYEGLEESQQSSSSSSAYSQPVPPLDYGDSQDSEPYIETPMVTPNGSLQWKDQGHIPIDLLDAASQLEIATEASKRLQSGSPSRSPEEFTLPRLYSPGRERTITTAISTTAAEPSRPMKRRRISLPQDPSLPSTSNPSQSKHPSTDTIDTVSPRYNLRQRATTQPPVSAPVRAPARGRAAPSVDVSSSQARSPAGRRKAPKAMTKEGGIGKTKKGKGRGG
ncbi:hypothetical protein BDP27DRAFT_1435074 [Rhodocollybia butyracea]|uniref:Uncharacterized protein n=1 Tax=Rhodocollybia butyracea TaxID=206335 RepID=A0A9P5TWL3_9AGAR|nr:hypothetical protein BDP27DRAFT_1435074 [Rhodocollybia butyracea]